jgi:uncharacterized protein
VPTPVTLINALMDKLLLTLISLILCCTVTPSATGASAVATNPDTDDCGYAENWPTLAEAKAHALAQCPGGTIRFFGTTPGWWSIERYKDSENKEAFFVARNYRTEAEAIAASRATMKEQSFTFNGHVHAWYETGRSDSKSIEGSAQHNPLYPTPSPSPTPPAKSDTVELTKGQVPTDILSASARNNLGVDYWEGQGVQQDRRRAAGLFRQAADQGLVEAQYNLGVLYKQGRGVPQDRRESVAWARKAAEQGYAPAQNFLGDCYRWGSGLHMDQDQAELWYRKATDQGYAAAQNSLALIHDNRRDSAMAQAFYRKAADQGYAKAQYALGLRYLDGVFVDKDPPQAAEWLRQAATGGYAPAQCALGELYDLGVGVPKDSALAAGWNQRAADQGYVLALRKLYREGQEPWEKNLKSMSLKDQAAAAQTDAAENDLGELIPDFERALPLLHKAAARGYAPAQFDLGKIYEKGYGEARNYAMALSLYRKAAEQGYAPADCYLGYMYGFGRGVPKDIARGVALFRKSADQGYAEAKYSLAVSYEEGKGVPEDIDHALSLYREAAIQSEEDALQDVERIEKNLGDKIEHSK